jgi:hypothetical protein
MNAVNMNEGQRLAELEKQVQGTLSQKQYQATCSNPQRHQWEALQKKYLRALEQKEKVTERDFEKVITES